MYYEIVDPQYNIKHSIFSSKGSEILSNYIEESKIIPINKIVGINSHPFVLYYFKNLDNFETDNKISSILLIGEEHDFSKYKCKLSEKDCYNIEEFQKKIFNYIDKMGCTLDVFIENYTKATEINSTDVYESFVKTEESMLKSWENRFIMKSKYDFLNLLENNVEGDLINEYNNVFFHLIDLRYMFNEKLNIFVALKLLKFDINKMFPWFKYNKKNVKSILIYLICKRNIDNKKYFNRGERFINKMSKSIDKTMGLKIKTYSFKKFINLYRELISMILVNFNNDHKFIDDYIKSVLTIAFVFGHEYFFDTLDSILMDIYNLNKMFIISRKNLLFYGGGWHCMLYCEFIKQHYSKLPNINSKNKIFEELILENFNYECGV